MAVYKRYNLRNLINYKFYQVFKRILKIIMIKLNVKPIFVK